MEVTGGRQQATGNRDTPGLKYNPGIGHY